MSLPPNYFILFTSYPLNYYFGILACYLGCFPLDFRSYNLMSVYFFNIIFNFCSFVNSTELNIALLLKIIKKYSTYIDFVENQLFPSLISLSPLTTNHPNLLQQTRVRSSKICYYFFNLFMVRSLSFGFN